MLRYVLGLCLLGALAGGCGDGGSSDGGGRDFSEVEAALQRFVDDNDDVEGLSAIVVHRDDGVVYRAAFGAFDEARVYLLASATKVLTAGVVMHLVDEGALALDAPIDDYVDWAGSRPGVTFGNMLSNSSGLIGLGGVTATAVYPAHVCQFLPTSVLRECAETIYGADDADVTVAPETTFRYGGGQWQLAGGIAEQLAGRSWATLVDETYNVPCGTAIGYDSPYLATTAGSYPDYFNGDAADAMETENPHMEGGAYANIDDYGEVLLMHLRGGLCGDGARALSEASVAEMQVDRVAAYGETGSELSGYGLGWWIDRDAPGVFIDPGLFGAQPWIDTGRGYGVMLAVETGRAGAGALRDEVRAALEAIFDAEAEASP